MTASPHLRTCFALWLGVSVAACGGGGGSTSGPTAPVTPPLTPVVNIDTTVFASGAVDAAQAGSAEASFVGPDVVLASPANVQVCVSGTWVQQLRGPGTVSSFTISVAPVALSPRPGLAVDEFVSLGPISIPFSQCDTHALPAGTHALRYQVRMDCPAFCLAAFTSDLRWRVQSVN